MAPDRQRVTAPHSKAYLVAARKSARKVHDSLKILTWAILGGQVCTPAIDAQASVLSLNPLRALTVSPAEFVEFSERLHQHLNAACTVRDVDSDGLAIVWQCKLDKSPL